MQTHRRARFGHTHLGWDWCGRRQCKRERRKSCGIGRVGFVRRTVVDAVMRDSRECRTRVVRVAEVTRREGLSVQTRAIAVGGEGRIWAFRERRDQEEPRPNQPGQPSEDASDRMHPVSQYSDSHGRRD